jgi:nucleoid-associated protein YgaU
VTVTNGLPSLVAINIRLRTANISGLVSGPNGAVAPNNWLSVSESRTGTYLEPTIEGPITDEDGRYFYNLLQNIIFPDNLPTGFFNYYDVSPGDTLPFISYKTYKSIHLWWTICLVNGIDNPTIKLEPGTKLKILKDDTVKLLIRELNS